MAERDATSHRQILRSSSIIGGAAIINIAVGLAKAKVVALILGPVGLGAIVLLQNLMQTAASIGGMGLGQAGTRSVAEAIASRDDTRVALVRRTLVVATAMLGLVSSAAVWIGSDVLADWVAPGAHSGWQVRWLAIGVGAIVVTQAQTALLMGFRGVGDLAQVSTLSVLVSAAVGVAAVWWWGAGGIVGFVLVQVLATLAIGYPYVRRLPRRRPVALPMAAVRRQLGTMLSFGLALTVAAVCVNVGQLLARTLIQQQLGAAAVGLFQASWLISVTYIGFVLQAMGTDFYPRIVAANTDSKLLARLVNEQIEVALLLASPVLLSMLAVAPWLMRLLYARAFDPAVGVLQWQILADVLKVASWPLGYLLLAINSSRIYMAAEIGVMLVLLAALRLLLPLIGLEASGLSVLIMYAVYLPLMYGLSARRTGFRMTRRNFALVAGLFAACAIVQLACRVSPIVGAGLGAMMALAAGVLCLRWLKDALPGPLGKLAALRLRRSGV